MRPRSAILQHISLSVPVIVGSGRTIANATYCLCFARLPYFSTMGVPVVIGMIVAVLSAVTLGRTCCSPAARSAGTSPNRLAAAGSGGGGYFRRALARTGFRGRLRDRPRRDDGTAWLHNDRY